MATHPPAPEESLTVAILTISDAVSQGTREDASGAVLREMLSPLGPIAAAQVVPDDVAAISGALKAFCEQGVRIVVTTGGTGLSPRDVTPEATRAVIEREVPGIAEAMRAATLPKTRMAMLSRAVCGTRGDTLILNLPGSPKGVRECLEVTLPVLAHAAHIIRGGGHG